MDFKNEGRRPYNALDLAKYIVTKCIIDNKPIDNIQLNRILYSIQKNFVKRNMIAFHEPIEAWQICSIVPKVYYYFCTNGTMPILFNFEDEYKAFCDSENDSDKKIIDEIIEEKRELKMWDWFEKLQNSESAWSKVYADGKGNKQKIPLSLIKKYD